MRTLLAAALALLTLATPVSAQKHCVKGIPCGGSCISATKVCHVGSSSATQTPRAGIASPAAALSASAIPMAAVGSPYVAPVYGPHPGYTTSALKLRRDPWANAAVLFTIPRYAAVTIDDCIADWCPVTYQGRKGFSAKQYLANGTMPALVAEPVGRGYTSPAGEHVPSPRRSTNGQVPAGASARCRDGTFSFSRSRRGTCSHHGGVEMWL